MRIVAIIVLFTCIAMLWAIAHILYKPVYDLIGEAEAKGEGDAEPEAETEAEDEGEGKR